MVRCVPFSRFAGMSRRLLLVNQQLRNDVGHHVDFNRCIANAAAATINPVVVAHREFDASILRPHRVEGIFRSDWRSQPPGWIARNGRLLGILENISAVRFRSDLRRFGALVSPDDLVFAQMVAPRHLEAWLSWMAGQETPPYLFLHFGYQPYRFRGAETRLALRCLQRDRQAKTYFVTDSEKMVGPLEEVLGSKVWHLPHVLQWSAASDEQGKQEGSPIFFAAGNARYEKGFPELVEAANEIKDLLASKQCRLRVQCHEPDPLSRCALESRPHLEGIEWIDRTLSRFEYESAMNSCHAVLLPYHLDHYGLRTSGVFCEARAAGKPVVATKGSWAGDRISREGGGWLCEERNAVSLANAVRKAVETHAAVAKQALLLQSAARQEFSPARFVDNLLHLSRGGSY